MAPDIRALTICVEYDDLLAITLPRNARHFSRVLVVTNTTDDATVKVAQAVPNARILRTDVFYTRGAPFAKGLAVEQGLDALGRDGWLCIWDADTLLPEAPDFSALRFGQLHTPRRRILHDPREWRPELDWGGLLQVADREHAGYCQFFHARDPVLIGRPPWYGTRWRHAAGCDSDFQAHWPPSRKIWLPWEVLHLGAHGKNWHGRWTVRTDGTFPPKAAERLVAQAAMWQARHRHRYKQEWFDEQEA